MKDKKIMSVEEKKEQIKKDKGGAFSMKENGEISIFGRIKKIRDFGNIIFIDISYQNGEIQLKFIKKERKEKINIGDIINAKGYFCETTSKIPTIEISNIKVLKKCLKSLGNEHYGFKNVEERFRKRYLDFIINPEKRYEIIKRSKIIKEIRNYLENEDFIEVETPILVSESSGAQAKPFLTYHNKLKKNFFLRIATEISLKKMLVGGFEKIYEIGKIFRNEGVDSKHNPEFTTIEIYHAYKNMEYMMNLTEKLFIHLSNLFLDEKIINFNEKKIKIDNFNRISMIESIEKKTGVNFKNKNLKEANKMAEKFNVKLEEFQKKEIGHIIMTFFEKFVEKEIIDPTFIFDYPIEISPLSKSKEKDEKIAERFELYIAGIEFANGYSELNDSKEQKKRFDEQLKQKRLGNEEIMNIDNDFIEALEYGMPPAGGLGIGIDRLIMLLTKNESIKEVIVFPQLKNKDEND